MKLSAEIDTTKLVIVSQYYDLPDAHLGQGILKSHNIECKLENELSNSLGCHYKNIVPIRLWVQEEDAAKATQILGQPVSDPQIPAYEEPPLGRWGKTKRIFSDVWRALTLS